MKTKQEQIEEMARVIRTWENVGDVNYRFGTHYANMLYKAGYRKASDVIDEFVDKIFEKIRYEYKNYPNAMTVGTYYQLRKEINELADKMRQEVEE